METVRRLARHARGLLWLDFGGGEPYLRHDLAEIAASFQAPDLTIPTSGSDPPRIARETERIRGAHAGDLTVAVSLDGPRSVNDALRGP